MRKDDAKERKDTPVYSGVLKYFPNALAEVARVSKAGNDQHNPGKALHWDRSKSKDELDALTRHLLDRAAGDEFDRDGQRHMAKVAWRALAALEKELEIQAGVDRDAWRKGTIWEDGAESQNVHELMRTLRRKDDGDEYIKPGGTL